MNNKIRKIIDSRHLKISQFVNNLNVVKSYFYDVMNDKTVPSLTMAKKFSRELRFL